MTKIKKRPVTTWEGLPPILDPPAVAMLLGIPIESVWKLAKKGKIPGFRVGKLWRFEKKALMKFAGVETHASDRTLR